MTQERANTIFDILIKYGNATESLRDDFVYKHTIAINICKEYRFQGSLGFGGKYYSEKNKVGCYKEDETPGRLKLINFINEKLKEMDENCSTFESELTQLLNRYSKENDSNTPDFILAEFLIGQLKVFNETLQKREKWYSPHNGFPLETETFDHNSNNSPEAIDLEHRPID